MIHLAVNEGIGTLTMDRPPVNAWDHDQLDFFEEALAEIRSRADIRAVMVTGAGQHFSSGGDIKMMVEAIQHSSISTLDGFAARIQALFSEWDALAIPTVAAINGAAVGGGLELALACDLRMAARSARIGLPEVRLGLLPAAGGTQRLTRLVGPGRALRLMLAGELIDGCEAERIGIVEWCVPDDELESAAQRVARSLAAIGGPAQAAIKACVRAAPSEPGFEMELQHQHQLHETPDSTRRLRAFADSRRTQ